MGYARLFWATVTFFKNYFIGHFSSGDTDIIFMLFWDFDKSLYLYLWIGYDNPVCTVGTKKSFHKSLLQVFDVVAWL